MKIESRLQFIIDDFSEFRKEKQPSMLWGQMRWGQILTINSLRCGQILKMTTNSI